MRNCIIAAIISFFVGGATTGIGLYVYTSGRLELANREISATKESLVSAQGRITELEVIGDGLRTDNKQLRDTVGILRGKAGGIGDSVDRSEKLNNRRVELDGEIEALIAKYPVVQ